MNDPLRRLPYEAWFECLRFASSELVEGPLSFMFVSQSWMNAVLDEPGLWTTLNLDHGGVDEAERVHLFLHLSRNHPLDVVLLCQPKSFICIEMLKPHAERIRSIRTEPFTYKYSQKDIVEWFIKGVSCYPQMEVLDVRVHSGHSTKWEDAIFGSQGLDGYDGWREMIRICPNLRIIKGHSLSPTMVHSSNIKDATVRLESLDQALDIISAERFNTLGLDCRKIGTNYEEWVAERKRFFIGNFSVLKSLDIDLQLEDLGFFSSLITTLSQLRSVALRIYEGKHHLDPWKAPSFPQDEFDRIEKFSITWTGGKEDMVSDMMSMLTRNKTLLNIKYFSFKIDRVLRWEIVRLLLLTLNNVRKLKLEISLSNLPTGKVVVMSSVKYLYLDSGSILRGVEVPNAIGVIIGAGSFDDIHIRGPCISYLQIGGNSSPKERYVDAHIIKSLLPSLTRLSCDRWHGVTIYLRSLQMVEFTFDEKRVINEFLLDLIGYPEALPHLRTIKSDWAPTWELLFEVLRRRSYRSIASIKQLTLKTYPAIPILSRLVLLLQGRSDIHTADDIDDVIYRRFNDENKKFIACARCIPFGYRSCLFGDERQIEDAHSLVSDELYDLCDDELCASTPVWRPEKSELLDQIHYWQKTESERHKTGSYRRFARESCDRYWGYVDINECTPIGRTSLFSIQPREPTSYDRFLSVFNHLWSNVISSTEMAALTYSG